MKKKEKVIKSIEELVDYHNTEKRDKNLDDIEIINVEDIKKDEAALNEKINDYLVKRLAMLVTLNKIPADVIDGVIDKEENQIIKVVRAIRDFCVENKNSLPEDLFQNATYFLSHEGIRFNPKYAHTTVNDDINDVIGVANSAVFTDHSFLINEGLKFFQTGKAREKLEFDTETIFELEERVNEYALDLLFATDEEFIAKYVIGEDGVGNPVALCVINYLSADFPAIFKNEEFLERTSVILSCNRKASSYKFFLANLLSDRTLLQKISYQIDTNKLVKHNKVVMNHVVQGFKRS